MKYFATILDYFVVSWSNIKFIISSYVLSDHLFNRFNEAAEFLDGLTTTGVTLLADLFHMSIEPRNIAESIDAAGDYIKYAHLADSTCQFPGYGHYDFATGFEL